MRRHGAAGGPDRQCRQGGRLRGQYAQGKTSIALSLTCLYKLTDRQIEKEPGAFQANMLEG